MNTPILTKLNGLPIMGDIEASEMKDIIASICGVTPDGIMKVRAWFKELLEPEDVIEGLTTHSLSEAATQAMTPMNVMQIFKKTAPAWKRVACGGPTWKRVGSFLVLSVPRYLLFGAGPSDPISLIVRTAKSTWKQYDLSMYVLPE